MNRLTIKDKAVRDNFNAEYAKLADLEDIEEELGIDLITLFKALIKGIWVKSTNGDVYYVGSPYLCFTENEIRELELQFRVGDTRYKIKDYGKTWALSKKCFEKKESKMKILNNKEQNKLIEKIMELNSLIANSNVDLEAFDLLGDIMCSALDMRHTIRVKDALIEELKNKGTKE